MADRPPKLLTPDDLRDRRKYGVVTLPVFGPNQRLYLTPDGTAIQLSVTPTDLPAICEASNRAWTDLWVPGVLAQGHRRQGYQIPESQQPLICGWAVNYRVAEYAGKPWIWADLYYRHGVGRPIGDFPFRSAEYDHEAKRITGVALLIQSPFLDQGTVVPYQRGATMPAEWTPDEEAQFAKCVAYMKAKFPKMAAYMDAPTDTNTDVPNLPASPQPGNPQASYQAAPEYKAALSENATLRAERTLDALAYEGVRFDRTVELPKLVGMNPTEQAAHVNYMRSTYQRNPLPVGGGWIPTATAQQAQPKPDPADAPPRLTAAEATKAVNYQRAGSLDYDAAVAKVIAERK